MDFPTIAMILVVLGFISTIGYSIIEITSET